MKTLLILFSIMSDPNYVKPKRWEGKPLAFKFKYLYANYPEIALLSFLGFIVVPALAAVRLYFYPGSRQDVMKKFKDTYKVVRDDDPKAEFYKAQNERGQHHFPKY